MRICNHEIQGGFATGGALKQIGVVILQMEGKSIDPSVFELLVFGGN